MLLPTLIRTQACSKVRVYRHGDTARCPASIAESIPSACRLMTLMIDKQSRSAKLGSVAGLIVLATISTSSAAVLSGPARIIDGDTLKISGVVVSLHWIDAPEVGLSSEVKIWPLLGVRP